MCSIDKTSFSISFLSFVESNILQAPNKDAFRTFSIFDLSTFAKKPISIAIAIGVNDQLTMNSMFTSIPEQFASAFVKFFSKLGL